MFTDELAGNASKKRQDQAKERRRKLIAEQKKQKAKDTSTTSSSADSSVDNQPTPLAKSDGEDTNKVDIKAVKAAAETVSQPTAVEKALEQRRIRSIQKLHNSSAVIIQSTYRAYKSNGALVKQQKEVLEKRLGDLMTLSRLLQKQNKSYVPPPSLVSLMLNQMLFVLHSTARCRRVKLIQKTSNVEKDAFVHFSTILRTLTKVDANIVARMVEFAVLPGLLSSDEHLDPAVVWLESKDGQMKFKKLLRLCSHLIRARQCDASKKAGKIVHVVMPLVANEEEVGVIYKLLEVLLGYNELERARPPVTSFCRKIFLCATPDFTVQKPGGIVFGQTPTSMEVLDLLHILRSYLLYPSNRRVSVVPPNAERDRRKCIPQSDRLRADGLFRLLAKVVTATNDLNLCGRFVSEIFTVPLFTWRIEQSTINSSVCRGEHQKSTEPPPFMNLVSSFMKRYQTELLNDLAKILPSSDIPLTICTAPPVLSLCANMAQFGTMCPQINGIDRSAFNSKGTRIMQC